MTSLPHPFLTNTEIQFPDMELASERADFCRWLLLRLIHRSLRDAKIEATSKIELKIKYQAQQWLADLPCEYASITFEECCDMLNINRKLVLKVNNLLSLKEA